MQRQRGLLINPSYSVNVDERQGIAIEDRESREIALPDEQNEFAGLFM